MDGALGDIELHVFHGEEAGKFHGQILGPEDRLSTHRVSSSPVFSV
jgi:hypothetical protein